MNARGCGEPPPGQAGWAYFLDFDGTLVGLAATPDRVVADAGLVALLDALRRRTGGAVALVSGRSIADLEARFDGGLRRLGLAVAGQHGCERRAARGGGPGGGEEECVAVRAAAPALRRAAALLQRCCGELRLEDKGASLALHYRQVPELGPWALRLASAVAARCGGGIAVESGRCLVELHPADVDKGGAVAAFLTETPFRGRRPVCIGDDRGDHAAFRVANACGGVSIRVGAGVCAPARYRLDDVAAVRRWLAAVAGT